MKNIFHSIIRKFIRYKDLPKIYKKERALEYLLSPTEKYLFETLQSGYLKDIGWFKAVETKKCVDIDNNPLPWVTYPFIHFIEPKLRNVGSLFEFGSGYSTLFYAKYVDKITTVEHDKVWYDQIKNQMPANVTLLYKELEYGKEYSFAATGSSENFDLIIVDGRDRVNCFINSIPKLKKQGVMILDDSERSEYAKALEFAKESNFKQLDFWGISPGLYYKKCTSIFYRSENILNI